MTAAVRAAGLTKHFGGVRAVDSIDIAFGSEEIVGVIGPNGSGKSTLFNCVSGFLRPTAGTVEWDGVDVTRWRPDRRSRAGLVRTFQERVVFDGIPVHDSFLLALRSRGGTDADAAIEQTLTTVGLPPTVLPRLGSELSWGQTRLLGIALALLRGPRILLLDEPFAGLNRVAAIEVLDALRAAHGQGIGLVIVEHEMSLLLPLCSRVVVLAAGAVIAEGRPDGILDHPAVQQAYFGDRALGRRPS